MDPKLSLFKEVFMVYRSTSVRPDSQDVVVPFVPLIQADAKILITQIILSLLKEGPLKVSEKTIRNTRETLEKHNEAHREAALRRRCSESFTRALEVQ